MRYEIVSSLKFGQFMQDGQTDGKLSANAYRPTMHTKVGSNIKGRMDTISLLEMPKTFALTMCAIQQTVHLIYLQCVNNSGKTDKLYLHPKNNSFLGKVMQKLSKYDNEISPNRGLESI